ncbi:MAG: hypothetical protein KGL77_02305 [Actinomycetales bacterium]|nr:hypothetical protein [Actinomycetales bacterium]
MSSIPLLGGLSALSVAASLTLMSVSELQFQDRAVKSEAEFLAVAVAEQTPTFASQQELDAALGSIVDNPGLVPPGVVSMWVAATDGLTVTIRECRAVQHWTLPWLTGLLPQQQVCAEASARAI